MTKSESNFERLCEAAGWELQRVPETDSRRPDYILTTPSSSRIIVEVKQFEPNPEERALLARQARGEVVVFPTLPGERIRRAIRSAGPQLKALAPQGDSSMLVVFHATSVATMHTDPYSVLTAMRGIDVVPVLVPADPQKSPSFGSSRPGPHKKMTADANTSISCIAVLAESEGDVTLNVFHNPHAARPLDPGTISASSIRHWRMSRDQSDWEPA